jgi:hypothetical protein
MMGKPMRLISELTYIISARFLYRSPAQDPAYITKAEKTYGGEPRHCDAATLNLRFCLKTIGRKKAKEYETVVVRL